MKVENTKLSETKWEEKIIVFQLLAGFEKELAFSSLTWLAEY